MYSLKIVFALSSLLLSVCGQTLKNGTPESVGLLSAPLAEMVINLTAYTKPANYGVPTKNQIHPVEPGSVTLVARNSTIVSAFAVGYRNLYADVNGTFLPSHLQELTTLDTIYDMASLTKLFTTVAALRELDSKRLSLNATVASYLPSFAVNGKGNITILMLLTHTSGFDADPVPALNDPVYKTYEERINAVITQKLLNPPGSKYVYSDLNFMTLTLVLECITSKPLDKLISEYTTALGMTSTFFNRGNRKLPRHIYYRMATQEFQLDVMGPPAPVRPQPVRGTVHDENAWSLNGVSGHAGLFSTVHDTAAFCQMILNRGKYNGQQIVSPESIDMIFYNFNARFGSENAHGLGFELNQTSWDGPMRSVQTAGHTGFTGTTLAIDRPTNTFFLHFSNRVHPSRNWSSNNIVREAVGYWTAKSLGRTVNFPY